MSTPDSARVQLSNVAEEIYTERRAILNAIARISKAVTNLGAIPSKYQDLVDFIGTLSAADGTWEANVIAEFDKLQTSFQTLKAKANDAKLDLDAYDFNT